MSRFSSNELEFTIEGVHIHCGAGDGRQTAVDQGRLEARINMCHDQLLSEFHDVGCQSYWARVIKTCYPVYLWNQDDSNLLKVGGNLV